MIYGDQTTIKSSVCVNGPIIPVSGRAVGATVKPGLLLKRESTYTNGFEVCSAAWGYTTSSGKPAMYQAEITAGNHGGSNVAFDKSTAYTAGMLCYPIRHVVGGQYKMICAEASITEDDLMITGASGVIIAHTVTHNATPLTLHAYRCVQTISSGTEVLGEYLGLVTMFTTTA